MKKVKAALQLSAYTSLVKYSMTIYTGLGVGTVLTTYFTTYYFELSEKELAGLPIAAALGGITALYVAPLMGKHLDKKKSVILSSLGLGIFFCLPFLLRLVNLFPENNNPNLLPCYLLTLWIAYTFLWVSISTTNSMMAEVVDQFESLYKKRNEGFFFSTMSFAYKCTVGLGYFVGGLLLDLIQFPTKVTDINSIDPNAIHGLGLIGGPILLVFYLVSIVFIRHYPIDKTTYLEIKNKIYS